MSNSIFSKINIKRSEILKSPSRSSQTDQNSHQLKPKVFDTHSFERIKKFDDNPHETSMELRHSLFEYEINESYDSKNLKAEEEQILSMSINRSINEGENEGNILEQHSNLLDTPKSLFSTLLEPTLNSLNSIKPFVENDENDSTNIIFTPL